MPPRRQRTASSDNQPMLKHPPNSAVSNNSNKAVYAAPTTITSHATAATPAPQILPVMLVRDALTTPWGIAIAEGIAWPKSSSMGAGGKQQDQPRLNSQFPRTRIQLLNDTTCPAALAGLRSGDIIVGIEGNNMIKDQAVLKAHMSRSLSLRLFIERAAAPTNSGQRRELPRFPLPPGSAEAEQLQQELLQQKQQQQRLLQQQQQEQQQEREQRQNESSMKKNPKQESAVQFESLPLTTDDNKAFNAESFKSPEPNQQMQVNSNFLLRELQRRKTEHELQALDEFRGEQQQQQQHQQENQPKEQEQIQSPPQRRSAVSTLHSTNDSSPPIKQAPSAEKPKPGQLPRGPGSGNASASSPAKHLGWLHALVAPSCPAVSVKTTGEAVVMSEPLRMRSQSEIDAERKRLLDLLQKINK